jgi:hypothetical protein
MKRQLSRRDAFLAVGTYSHGTLRPEDVIPEMLSLLCSFPGTKRLVAQFEADFEKVSAAYESEDQDKIDHYTWDDLWHDVDYVINERLPRQFYWGTHIGDGSDFGIWYTGPMPEIDETGSPKGEFWSFE